MADAPLMAGSPFWSPAAPAASQATAIGSPRWAPGSASPAAIRPAPRRPLRASVPRRVAQRWMLLPRTCRFKPGCAVWPLRCWTPTRGWTYWSTTPAGSGRTGTSPRWPGAHLRAEPPRAVPADQPAARLPHRERTRPDPHRLLRRPHQGPHRLRRPAGRAELLRAARLQPVEAGQRDVHLRASPPPGRHRRDRHGPAPRRGTHQLRRRRPGGIPRRHDRRGAPVHEDPGQGAATPIYLASSPESRASPAGTSSTANPRPPATPPTTPQPRPLWQASIDLAGMTATA